MDNDGLKILYVLHWFPALSETFILREILEMQKLGAEVDVVRLNESPDKISHPEVKQFGGKIFELAGNFWDSLSAHIFWITERPEIYFGTLFLILSKISHPKTVTVSLRTMCKALKFAHMLRESDYHHVHAHFGTAPATAAWIIASLLERPYSFTLHAVGVFLPDKLLVRKVADSKFTAVISNFNIEYLKKHFPSIDASKLKLVRCGIRPDEIAFKQKTSIKKTPVVLSIGRMVETKGFRYLIEAIRILKDRGKQISLIIIGGGEKLSEYRQMADDLGVNNQITFTGPLSSSDVKDAFNYADLFVLAACVGENGDRDGIPVVLMEALAYGIPTVSTEVSGIPELVIPFETGLLVPEQDPKSLADAISLYLNERDLRERLPKSGRKLVEREFDVILNSRKLLNLIELEDFFETRIPI